MADEAANRADVPLHEESEASPEPHDNGGGATSSVSWRSLLGLCALDAVASAAFWSVLLLWSYSLMVWCIFFLLLAVAMAGWRVYRAQLRPEAGAVEMPYTCGVATSNGKQLFLVATLHISPRAPRDVEAVIRAVGPDTVMVELDEERMEDLDDVEANERRGQEDLQPIKVAMAGVDDTTIYAQRALWNAEYAGQTLSAAVSFDTTNPYAIANASEAWGGKIALVRRGGPLAMKAHVAARSGALAVFVVNHEDAVPRHRIGQGTLWGDFKLAARTRSCGFPPIPVLLLPQRDGERLRELCDQPGGPQAELQVMADSFPRRTLRRRLCQSCAMTFSGIGVLYLVIECLNVEVGAEFLAAKDAARLLGLPCVCIDVDLDRFWSRLARAVVPTPRNLAESLRSWLAFPRMLLLSLFPGRSSVDVLGSSVLHVASFPLRTWVAFVLAAVCAGLIVGLLLQLLGFGAAQAGEKAGVIKSGGEDVQSLIMLALELYVLPRVYEAVAASRDESMSQNIIAKSREMAAHRIVVVVGAAHANGILQRIRARGL